MPWVELAALSPKLRAIQSWMKETKRHILYESHDAPVGGHRGMNRTFRAIKSRYTWPNTRRDIEEYVKQCKSWQVNKTLKPNRKAPMEVTSTANHPFDKCYLDIVGPLPPSDEGNRYSLTFQDDLSKYVVARPPLWSSGQSFWLQIQRSRVRFPALPDFPE